MTDTTGAGIDLDAHVAAYRRDGFTILRDLFPDALRERLRAAYPSIARRATGRPEDETEGTWIRSSLEYEPELMLEAVAHPTLIGFAERVMGPFVQLDNLTFATFPTVDPATTESRVSGWHRDIWAGMPPGTYVHPLAINAICYLQDMTDDLGRLRVIRGSHLRPVDLKREDAGRPHPDEEQVDLGGGDVVVTHNGLFHSGTRNVSGRPRWFFSIYYNRTWLRCRDNHDGPGAQRLLAEAKKRGDRRVQRLLGHDEKLIERANSGWFEAEEILWAKWAAEDDEHEATHGGGNGDE